MREAPWGAGILPVVVRESRSRSGRNPGRPESYKILLTYHLRPATYLRIGDLFAGGALLGKACDRGSRSPELAARRKARFEKGRLVAGALAEFLV